MTRHLHSDSVLLIYRTMCRRIFVIGKCFWESSAMKLEQVGRHKSHTSHR